jgi:hypothetical protein
LDITIGGKKVEKKSQQGNQPAKADKKLHRLNENRIEFSGRQSKCKFHQSLR